MLLAPVFHGSSAAQPSPGGERRAGQIFCLLSLCIAGSSSPRSSAPCRDRCLLCCPGSACPSASQCLAPSFGFILSRPSGRRAGLTSSPWRRAAASCLCCPPSCSSPSRDFSLVRSDVLPLSAYQRVAAGTACSAGPETQPRTLAVRAFSDASACRAVLFAALSPCRRNKQGSLSGTACEQAHCHPGCLAKCLLSALSSRCSQLWRRGRAGRHLEACTLTSAVPAAPMGNRGAGAPLGKGSKASGRVLFGLHSDLSGDSY